MASVADVPVAYPEADEFLSEKLHPDEASITTQIADAVERAFAPNISPAARVAMCTRNRQVL